MKMSDEKNEEKMQINPPDRATDMPRFIEEIANALTRKSSALRTIFDGLLEELDEFSSDFSLSYFTPRGTTWVDGPYVTQLEQNINEGMKKVASKLINLNYAESFIDRWIEYYSEKRRNYDVDMWVLDFIEDLVEDNFLELKERGLTQEKANFINKVKKGALAGSNYENPSILDEVARILLNIPFYMEDGQDIKVRATAIRVYSQRFTEIEKSLSELKELKKNMENLRGKTSVELSRLKRNSEILTRRVEQTSQEIERRFLRNSVQIIGIFAAIIAFVVAVVPAAIRLGGSSIPIIGSGLAIVLAGFLFLIAVVFGDENRIKRFRGWLIGSGIALTIWLLVSIGASVLWRDIVAPPPDAARVDTVYKFQSRVDTLYIDTTTSE